MLKNAKVIASLVCSRARHSCFGYIPSRIFIWTMFGKRSTPVLWRRAPEESVHRFSHSERSYHLEKPQPQDVLCGNRPKPPCSVCPSPVNIPSSKPSKDVRSSVRSGIDSAALLDSSQSPPPLPHF